MQHFDGLPDSRTSLRGLTAEGDEAWLVRAVARKLYRCPRCGGAVEVGSDHVVVQRIGRGGGSAHQHWHRACADDLVLELRQVRTVSALESSPERLERRGRVKPGRRRRNLRRG